MSEILFRAKSNQTWYYGYVYQDYESSRNNKWRLNTFEGDTMMIDPNTIGQYTGLIDMNGIKIFEKDILEVLYHDIVIARIYIYYKYAMYISNLIFGDVDFETLGMLNANYSLRVIGNIYDNPELLEEADE